MASPRLDRGAGPARPGRPQTAHQPIRGDRSGHRWLASARWASLSDPELGLDHQHQRQYAVNFPASSRTIARTSCWQHNSHPPDAEGQALRHSLGS
jgi:hypothetical protein